MNSLSSRTSAPAAQPELGIGKLVGIGATAGLLCLTLIVGALALAIPFVTGSQTYSIITSSMEPTYPPGTLVIVQPTDPAELNVGAVITYQAKPGEPTVVTHRIIAVELSSTGSRAFKTMGDNNAVADAAPVTAEQVRGRVWYALPWLGVLSMIREVGAFGVIIPLVGLGLLLWSAYLIITWLIQRRHHTDVKSAQTPGEQLGEVG